jgi:hypothetical protein
MDTILGLIGLAAYIVGVVALSAAITYAVIKISPAQSSREKAKSESA